MLSYLKQLVTKNSQIPLSKCAKNQSPHSFDSIPTLPKWPIIGHGYLFFPKSKYSLERLSESIHQLSLILGPVFKLKFNGRDVVITLNADDVKIIAKNEGKTPQRPVFEALAHYREKEFKCCGIVPADGETWLINRRAINHILDANLVKQYKLAQEDIALEFVNYLASKRNNSDIIDNVFLHAMKFTIESISIVSPGKRYHCLSDKKFAQKIINANMQFMNGLYQSLLGPPIWKIIKTKPYKMLIEAHSTIYKLLKNDLEELGRNLSTNPTEIEKKSPFMYYLLKNKNIDWDHFIMLSMELFLGGIDSTATTLSMLLYYLSHNPEAQNKAREASQNNNLSYLRACLKETLRLMPTAGAHSRYLINETVISGYQVPAKTLVMAFLSITSRDEKYFVHPNKFSPERWTQKTNKNSFASLPFGFGSRMCPGLRFAEQEILIVVQKILERFKLEPITKDVGMIYRMNRIPDKDINIKFLDTNH